MASSTWLSFSSIDGRHAFQLVDGKVEVAHLKHDILPGVAVDGTIYNIFEHLVTFRCCGSIFSLGSASSKGAPLMRVAVAG